VPTIPACRLPAFHRWLVGQGAYERATLEKGYVQVLKRMVGVARDAEMGFPPARE
jgi:hypothetical protein